MTDQQREWTVAAAAVAAHYSAITQQHTAPRHGASIDREFEFYEFFSFLKFNEFYEFFSVEKNSQKNS